MIAIASDHGGYDLKEYIKEYLKERGLEYKDFGTYSKESCDYPDFAVPAAKAVSSGECKLGLIFCSTGIGVSMAANKVKGIRAACCSDTYSAHYTRLHNDANVLCVGGLVVGNGLAKMIVDEFLFTEFEGGRHQRRVDKIMAIENE